MATVNNIMGQFDQIKHKIGTYFNRSFKCQAIDDEGNLTDFDLTDYTLTFTTYTKKGGDVVLTIPVTKDGAVITITGNPAFEKPGTLYFELRAVAVADTNINYNPWYGSWTNED